MLITLNILLLIVGIASLVAFGFLLVSSFKRSVLWGLGVLLVPFVTFFYGIKFWQEVKKPFLIYLGTNTLSMIMACYLFLQLGGMQAIEMAGKINDGSMTEQEAAQFMVSTMNGMENLGAPGKDEMLAQMRADPKLTAEDIKQFEMMTSQIEAVASGEKPSFQDGWQEARADVSQKVAMTAPEETNVDDIEAKIAEVEAKLAMMNDAAQGPAPVEATPTGNNVTALGVPTPIYVESPIKEPAIPIVKKTSGAITLTEAGNYIGDIVSVTTHDGLTRRATLVDVSTKSLEFQRRAYGGSVTFSVPKREIKGLTLN